MLITYYALTDYNAPHVSLFADSKRRPYHYCIVEKKESESGLDREISVRGMIPVGKIVVDKGPATKAND